MGSRYRVLAILMGGIHFTFHLFMRLIPPLIPVLVVALDYPLWKLGMLVSAYFIGSSLGLLPMGVVSDRYDRRATLAGALAVVGAGYVLFAFAPAVGSAIPAVAVAGYAVDGPFVVMAAAMLLSGLGTSAHIPVGIPLITANVSPADRGKVLGVWGGGSKLGDAAAPALVGVLIIVLGWQAILLGFGVLGLGAAAVLYAVLGLREFDTRPAVDHAEEAATATTWADLLADRRRYLYPMLVLVGYFAGYSVVVQGTVTFVPSFITDVYGYTLTVAGFSVGPESFADFALSALLVGAAISRLAGGYLVDRYEHRAVMFGSLSVAAVALFVFSVFSLGPLALLVVLVIFGAGLWGNSPARDSLVSDLSPDDHEGRTFSYLWTASRAFGALSPTLIGFLASSVGIRRGFLYLSVATAVAALFVALLFSGRVYVADPPEAAVAPDD